MKKEEKEGMQIDSSTNRPSDFSVASQSIAASTAAVKAAEIAAVRRAASRPPSCPARDRGRGWDALIASPFFFNRLAPAAHSLSHPFLPPLLASTPHELTLLAPAEAGAHQFGGRARPGAHLRHLSARAYGHSNRWPAEHDDRRYSRAGV